MVKNVFKTQVTNNVQINLQWPLEVIDNCSCIFLNNSIIIEKCKAYRIKNKAKFG